MSVVSSAASGPPTAEPAAPRRLSGWAQRGLGLALALPLLVYASIGSFSRYVADDYCWAGVLRTEGYVRSQVLWYTGYSPRYAFTFLVNTVELAGPAIVPALPLVAIITCLAVLTWTFTQLTVGRLYALLLAETATVATLQTAPDLGQSLYWQTGMLTYLLPLVLATFVIGWIARAVQHGRARPLALLATLAITFFAGGLSETYLIPQNVALTLALAAALAFARGTPRTVATAHLGAGLAGGVLALLAIVFAPATTYRVGGPPADLWLAGTASIATAGVQVLRLARYFALTALLALAVPLVLRYSRRLGRLAEVSRAQQAETWRWLLLATAIVLITLPFCYFPSFYAQNGNPPARSLIVPGALLIGYLMFAGHSLGGLLRTDLRLPSLSPALALLVLAVVPLGIAAISFPERADAMQYAALWDAEDRQIRASRAAGETDLSVPPLPPFLDENFVTADRANWFNVCVARYYDVRTIAAVQ